MSPISIPLCTNPAPARLSRIMLKGTRAMPALNRLIALLTLVALSTFTYAQNETLPPRPGDARAPADRRADVMGRVTAVSPDGRTLTITAPPPRPAAAGDQPAPRPEPV